MRQDRGSTLVEVVISIVVIALLGAALATFLMTSASAIDKNRQQAIASQLTERAMEKARYTLASTGKCDVHMQMGGDIASVDGMGVSEVLTCPAAGALPVATYKVTVNKGDTVIDQQTGKMLVGTVAQ